MTQRFAVLLLITAQFMVATSIVGSKILVDELPMVWILFCRFFIAAVLLSALHGVRLWLKKPTNEMTLGQLGKRDWIIMTAQALCGGAIFNCLMLLGLHYTTASMAGIITSMLPAVITIFSVLFLAERLKRSSLFCIVLAVAGLMVINAANFKQANFHNLWGDFWIFLALLPEASYYVLAKFYPTRLPLFLTAAIMNLLNLPFVILGLLWWHPMLPALNVYSGAVLVAMGLSIGFFYVFWFAGCRFIKGSTAGLFTAIMPMATLFLAWLFIDESITTIQWLGMLMVIFSILINAKKSD